MDFFAPEHIPERIVDGVALLSAAFAFLAFRYKSRIAAVLGIVLALGVFGAAVMLDTVNVEDPGLELWFMVAVNGFLFSAGMLFFGFTPKEE